MDAAAVEGEISLGKRGEMVMVMVMDGEERTVRMGGLWWLAEAVTVARTGAERGMARVERLLRAVGGEDEETEEDGGDVCGGGGGGEMLGEEASDVSGGGEETTNSSGGLQLRRKIRDGVWAVE